MTTQIQGPNSNVCCAESETSEQDLAPNAGGPFGATVDLESTVVLVGVSRSVPQSSDEAYAGLVDPHLWPVEALERVLSAIESTR